MPTFKLIIVSPRDKVFDQEADSLVAPGTEGEFGVLAHHAPMIALVKRGITKVTADGATRLFVTGGGYVEVAHDEVSMLVDYAARAESIDDAKAKLQEHLKDVGDPDAIMQ